MDTSGKVPFSNDLGGKFAQVRIGFGHVGCFEKKYECAVLQVTGRIEFQGKAKLNMGSRIVVGSNGLLVIGKDFTISANSTIIAIKRIANGGDCLFSWGVLIMDSDFHHVSKIEGSEGDCTKDIEFDDHVWIGCRSLLLKGIGVSNNSVIAVNTFVTKSLMKVMLCWQGILL